MSRRNRHIENMSDTLNDINKEVQTLVETSVHTGDKLDGITEQLIKGNKVKPLEIIGVAAAIVGVIVAIISSFVANDKSGKPPLPGGTQCRHRNV